MEQLASHKIDYGLPEGPFTLFVFQIRFGSMEWKIRKRFKDFVQLHDELTAYIRSQHCAVALPKLPKKTLRKNFSAAFVKSRFGALCDFLCVLTCIDEVSSSPTLLTFLGALDNLTEKYNDQFLDSRVSLDRYVDEMADVGDLVLFHTETFLAASMRNLTSARYDHVGVVVSPCDDELFLLEATADGVSAYPLRRRLKQWTILCPQIVTRRLVTRRTAHFLQEARQFCLKVDGMEYGIWSNVLRRVDVPFEKQDKYFCSQLVSTFFKRVGLLPDDVKAHRTMPEDFSAEGTLPWNHQRCSWEAETMIVFNLPAVQHAKDKRHRRTRHRPKTPVRKP